MWVWLVAPSASAHIDLVVPASRYTDAFQKDGPCGKSDDLRGNDVTEYEPGATITVRWEETIDHDSHFRIAFDDDGTDDFVNPSAFGDLYNSDAVLLDDIPDEADYKYEVEVTLPDVECDNCTLQLIQVMHEGAFDLGDIYFSCADLVLVAGAKPPPPPAEETADTGAASTTPPPATGTDPDDGTAGTGSELELDEAGCAGGCSGLGDAPAALAMLTLVGAAARRRR